MGRAVQEFAKQKWVPEIVMGGGYSGSAGAGTPLYDMMNMMSLSAMKSIGLDMGIPIGKSTKK